MAKFESHVTFHIANAEKVKEIGVTRGWKYSQIDGDAIMGAKPWCYLTGYAPDANELLMAMRSVEQDAQAAGIVVERTKIEQIIWDTKTGVNDMPSHAPRG